MGQAFSISHVIIRDFLAGSANARLGRPSRFSAAFSNRPDSFWPCAPEGRTTYHGAAGASRRKVGGMLRRSKRRTTSASVGTSNQRVLAVQALAEVIPRF